MTWKILDIKFICIFWLSFSTCAL